VSDFAHAAYHTVPVRGIAEKSKTRARLVALLALIAAPTLAARPIATPSELYGPLYRAVEMGRLFPDSKTFADAVPRAAPTSPCQPRLRRRERRPAPTSPVTSRICGPN